MLPKLEKAEKLYLPKNAQQTKGVVLAAGRGDNLEELTADKPKAMIDIAGKPLLSHIAEAYRAVGAWLEEHDPQTPAAGEEARLHV